jgi:hypothetical protein
MNSLAALAGILALMIPEQSVFSERLKAHLREIHASLSIVMHLAQWLA